MEFGIPLLGVATILSGGAVGLALGLTGGGGSIFAVPLLIYVVGLSPERAMPVSLAAVALSALVGAIQSVRNELVARAPSVMFALGGVIGAPLGITVAKHIAARVLVAGFAVLALTVGALMWRSARRALTESGGAGRPEVGTDGELICVMAPDGQLRFTAPCAVLLTFIGVGTGFLSGMFGIGGGFLIVPALVLVTRMAAHRAIATSLVVIAVIGVSGAASALLHGRLDWSVLLPFAGGGAVGILVGRGLAARLAGPRLQQIFSLTIVCVGVGMFVDSIV